MADPSTNPPAVPSVITDLRADLAAVLAESAALRVDVHTAEAARTKANRINTGVLAVLAVFVGLVLVVAFQNTRIATQEQRVNEQIADCTTAGGTCYELSNVRTRAAISQIVLASVYVAECARLHPGESGPAFDAALEQCIAAKLAAAAPLPTVSPPAAGPSPSPSK